jgi:hypothetical protein
MIHDIMSQATKGCMIGGLFGLLMGGVTSAANMILYEKQEPLQYYDGSNKVNSFRSLDKFSQKFTLSEDLRILMKYMSYNESAYNAACTLTQRLIDLKTQFAEDRKKGRDAAQLIGIYQKVAIKADRQWRKLFQSVEHKNDSIGKKEAEKSANNLHVAYEDVLAEMRTEFQMNPQINMSQN